MTVLVGAIDGGYAYLGVDSLWSWDENFVRESKTSKFLNLKAIKAVSEEGLDTVTKNLSEEVLIASSGQDRFTQILEKVIIENPDLACFSTKSDLMELAEMFHKAVSKLGIGDSDNNQLPEHDMGFLLISKYSDRLWTLESDYSIGEYDDYVSGGSGSFLAESAMRALHKQNIVGEEAVLTAIETVNELHPYCGGKIEIRKIKIEK